MDNCYNERGKSIQELLCQFTQKINENVNLVNSQEERIKYLLNQGVELEVAKKIDDMYQKGLIENIIAGKLQYINVKLLGAKGNGLADDSEAFKKAYELIKKDPTLTLFAPMGEYKIDSPLVLENLRNVNIEGVIHGNITLIENGKKPRTHKSNIKIQGCEGDLTLKGFISAFIEINGCRNLILTGANDGFNEGFGYNILKLGFIENLTMNAPHTEVWINENLIMGGRFKTITMSGQGSVNDNQFLKPLCENTIFDIQKGDGNIWNDTRLEGHSKVDIHFHKNTYSNVIIQNYSETISRAFLPIEIHPPFDKPIRDDSGMNCIKRNENLIVERIVSINRFNNPKNISLTSDGMRLKPNNWQWIYKSEMVEIPNDTFNLIFLMPDQNCYLEVEFYDSSKQPVANPQIAFDSTTVGNATNGYENKSFARKDFWIPINPKLNPKVKYFSIKFRAPGEENKGEINKLEVLMTSYKPISQMVLQGLNKDNGQS